jgi:hypothetical protein
MKAPEPNEGLSMLGKMSHPLLRKQFATFEEAIEAGKFEVQEAWKDESRRTAIATDLKNVVRSSHQVIFVVLTELRDSTIDLMRARGIGDYEATGRELQDSFDRGIQILESIQSLANSFEAFFGPLEGTTDLANTIDTLRKMHSDMLDHWPRFSMDDVKRAQVEIERGEFLDLEQAFAQIAKVDTSEWRRRVAASRKH